VGEGTSFLSLYTIYQTAPSPGSAAIWPRIEPRSAPRRGRTPASSPRRGARADESRRPAVRPCGSFCHRPPVTLVSVRVLAEGGETSATGSRPSADDEPRFGPRRGSWAGNRDGRGSVARRIGAVGVVRRNCVASSGRRGVDGVADGHEPVATVRAAPLRLLAEVGVGAGGQPERPVGVTRGTVLIAFHALASARSALDDDGFDRPGGSLRAVGVDRPVGGDTPVYAISNLDRALPDVRTTI
jgi:hypothetical protein